MLAWIDALGASGLDGHDLSELGLKNGNLIVDDRRNGKRWTFDRINASLQRPAQGGVIFRLESDNPERAWALSAAMRPLADGVRAVGIEARQVAMRDILLALRHQGRRCRRRPAALRQHSRRNRRRRHAARGAGPGAGRLRHHLR